MTEEERELLEDDLFLEVENDELIRSLSDEALKAKLDKEAQIGAVGLLIGVVALPLIALSGVAATLIGRRKK